MYKDFTRQLLIYTSSLTILHIPFVGVFHLSKKSGNFAGNFHRVKNVFHLTQVPFVPRLPSQAPFLCDLRDKIKDMAATSEHEFPSEKFPAEKQDYLHVQMFRFSGKFSTGTIRKVVFRLLSNRNFRNLFVNGKLPVLREWYTVKECRDLNLYRDDLLSISVFWGMSHT